MNILRFPAVLLLLLLLVPGLMLNGRVIAQRLGGDDSWDRRNMMVAAAAAALQSPVVVAEALKKQNNEQNGEEAVAAVDSVYQYSVCDEEMSNQLLYHATALADAYRLGREAIQIPNHFLLNNVVVDNNPQEMIQHSSQLLPFGVIFDQMHFVKEIKQQLRLEAFFVTLEDDTKTNTFTATNTAAAAPLPCMRMETLMQVDAQLVRIILKTFFHPSKRIQNDIINPIHNAIISKQLNIRGGFEHGICLHHPNGEQQWQKTCQDWSNSNIPDDGLYHGNCNLEPTSASLLEALKVRGLVDYEEFYSFSGTTSRQEERDIQQQQHRHHQQQQQPWIYYIGGSTPPPPKELVESEYPVYTRNDFLPNTAADDLYRSLILPGQHEQQSSTNSTILLLREVWSFVDFIICQGFDRFVGNSVSTFSSMQIGLRGDNNANKAAYWYNSQSIPLATFWRAAYQVPIVYTYTELSMATGKHMLQSSIASVRAQMPNNAIHILYHGTNDTSFQSWLRQYNVTIHHHDPIWRIKIEEMRQHGNPAKSNLFLHSGNYFGTWQRIDIPLFLDTEYCLLLDADTILLRPFTLADFGLNLTRGIAMSSEIFYHDTTPSNAGVMLMNVPHMKRTYGDFLQFIMGHVETAKFDHPSPSDQGAYLVFYKNQTYFLSRKFNYKPYWHVSEQYFQQTFIVHFHGPKPHDYLKFIMGRSCDKAIKTLCHNAVTTARKPDSFLCQSIQIFAKSSMAVDPFAYCNTSFPDDLSHSIFCQTIFQAISRSNEDCTDFPRVIRTALDAVPRRLQLPWDIIKKNMGISVPKSLRRMYAASIVGWVIIIMAMYKWRKKPRVIAVMSLVWGFITMIFSFVHLPDDHF